MKLTIEPMRGTWRAQIDHQTEFADTLEELLLRLAPDAPEDYLWHAAEVLGAILGAEVVDAPQSEEQMSPQEWEEVRDLFLASFGPREVGESWQPTEAQQAYFEPERTEEAESATFPNTAPEIEDAR